MTLGETIILVYTLRGLLYSCNEINTHFIPLICERILCNIIYLISGNPAIEPKKYRMYFMILRKIHVYVHIKAYINILFKYRYHIVWQI